MPAARSRDGRSVALGPWRPVSEREAIRRRIPALAARGSSLADTRHGDQATGWSAEIAEGHLKAARTQAARLRPVSGAARARGRGHDLVGHDRRHDPAPEPARPIARHSLRVMPWDWRW